MKNYVNDYVNDDYANDDYVNDDYVNDDYVNDEYVNDEYVNDEYVNDDYVNEYVNDCISCHINHIFLTCCPMFYFCHLAWSFIFASLPEPKLI